MKRFAVFAIRRLLRPDTNSFGVMGFYFLGASMASEKGVYIIVTISVVVAGVALSIWESRQDDA